MGNSVQRIIKRVFDQFERADLVYGHGTDNAWDEAVALVLGIGNLPDEVASLDHELNADEIERIEALVTRRVETRVPLPYLLGRCTYVGRTFEVEPGVMVPRSPIGHLLGDRMQPWVHAPARVLDLCSGTGCLGLIAAQCYPGAAVTLLEIDALARKVAARNVARHDLGDRVTIVAGDVRHIDLTGPFDLVLCNPPYVDANAMAALPPEYRAEPVAGLAGGTDGLDLVAAVLGQLPRILGEGGVFVCEVGASATAFSSRFVDLRVTWLELPHGGEGVFVLDEVNLRDGR